jgi:chemotaxis methyl-accepting protein methylase
MHALVRSSGRRQQYFGTFFVRNRPQLQLISRLASEHPRGAPLRVAVLGCSIGAEAYSLAWVVRSATPDLSLRIDGVDISPEVLEVAREGLYPLGVAELANEPLCERLTREEIERIFETEPRGLRVRPWIREGIRWLVGDACDPAIVDGVGTYDVVVANDFLCHMEPAEARACLRNIGRLVDPGGHLVVSGVDLEVRTDVAADLGWKPVSELIEEIHEGDRSLRRSWPWRYWGLEPLDSGRRDWNLRYASVFQLGGAS